MSVSDERSHVRRFESIEELEGAVGTRVAESPWMTVSQETIDAFARLTDDPQWIHVDVERARRESPFGTTVAHGFLTLSLLTPLIQRSLALPKARFSINYGFDRIRFLSPVPAGADIRGAFGVHEVRRIDGGAQITWTAEVEIRGQEKPALAALWIGRVLL